MRLGGRVAAAIEVLDQMGRQHRPATETLKDWGNAHRFAGSGDRAAIGNLVFDSLRFRASSAWRMGAETSRAIVLATLHDHWPVALPELETALREDRHGPGALTADERSLLQGNRLEDAPPHVRADIPEWLFEHFVANFGDDAESEAAALASRAPLDLRVNTLKASPAKILKSLGRVQAVATPISPVGVRVPVRPGAQRMPNVQAEEGYRRGHFEIQDEASQIAAILVGAQPGEQVLDVCAGGGGKTLAMAATMDNRGQIFAYDADRHRLAPIYDRLKRAGIRNAQVRAPGADALDDLVGRMDRVLVDAPCTGTGTWRRRPDSKWKLTQDALEARKGEQDAILRAAMDFVRPGGFLCYVTCSLLAAENEERVYAFLEECPEFELVTVGEVWQDIFGFDRPKPWSSDLMTITMTPAATSTDGFFVAAMERRQ